ncbi:hypothetical protein VTH06DRAFT_1067 [Thermothelomyces fergusii]
MTLYAAGFNAWNQLRFEDARDDEPHDIPSFARVLRGSDVGSIRPFLSYTRVRTDDDGRWREAGLVPRAHERLRASDERVYASFVEASNGVVVVHDGVDTLLQYASLRSLLARDAPSHAFSGFRDVTQLVAYETGFAALTSTGRVWTWGDERYPACLGREPSDDSEKTAPSLTAWPMLAGTHHHHHHHDHYYNNSPASAPGPVMDLDDLPTGPVTKLAGGGYVLAALTAGGDLYCWGDAGRAAHAHAAGLSDAPAPVVVGGCGDDDDGEDVADVAVGDGHMLVLTAGGDVLVLGDNANGQLGLPGVSAAETWTRVDLAAVLDEGEVVAGVVAGPRSSFLITRRRDQP